MSHVAFLCLPFDRLAPSSRSSVAIVTSNLARQLADIGHSVAVLAPDAAVASQDDIFAGIRTIPVNVDSLKQARIEEFLYGLRESNVPFSVQEGHFPAWRSSIVAELQALAPKIVHLPSAGQFLPILARALPGVRLVLHLHDELWAHIPPRLAARYLAFASHIVCVNTRIASQLRARMPALRGRVSVLYNATDPTLFASAAAVRSASPRLLFVGRLSPEKGIHVLAAAVKLLHSEFPSLHTDLVGSRGLLPYDWLRWIARDDRPCRDLLPFYGQGLFGRAWRQLIDRGRHYVEVSLQQAGSARQSMTIHGFVPYSQLGSLYRGASVVVAPSVCNEIPMSVFEGMAASLPVVLSNDMKQDGPVEDGETASVVPRGDPVRLAAAIAELLKTPDKAASMSGEARARVLGQYTWRHTAERLDSIYRSL